jgi:hypothetical protein
MIYLRTKFQVPNFNGSLVVAAKLKANENFRTSAMLFFFYKEYRNRSRTF